MLVGAFEVEIGVGGGVVGSGQAALAHDGVPGGAGLEPDVEDVEAFGEGRGGVGEDGRGPVGGVGVGGGIVVGEQNARLGGEPVVGTMGAELIGDGADGGAGEERRAGLIEECGDGQAPGALAGDAPVGSRFKHAAHAVAAPLGDKLHCLMFQFEIG